MAEKIKFNRASALPSPVTAAHDGIWFIKPDGETYTDIYIIYQGVVIRDKSAINDDLVSSTSTYSSYKTVSEIALKTTISNFITATLTPDKLIAIGDVSGNTYKANLSALAAFIAPYVSALGASPYIATTGTVLSNPTEKSTALTFVGIGTFTQTTGGSIITSNPLNLLSWNGTTWSLTFGIPIDLTAYVLISNIVDNLTSSSITQPLSANQGKVIKNYLDRVGLASHNYTKLGENMTVGSSSILYQSSTFSTWGWVNAAVQNFNAVGFKIKSWDVSNPITQIRVVIRDTNNVGAILADVTIPYVFDNTLEQDVKIPLNTTVVNADNHPLWISYITNGYASIRGSAGFGSGAAKYGTTKNLALEPAQAVSTPTINGYTEFFTAVETIQLNPNFVENMYTEMDETHGISGGSLAKEALTETPVFVEFKYSSGISGSWGHELSTFCGQGQVLPPVQNFNGVKFGLRYWDAAHPVTSVRVLVRENDRFGNIITDQTLPFTAGHLVEQEMVAVFDSYLNPSLNSIWVEYTANNFCGIKLGNNDTVIGASARYRTTASVGNIFADASSDDSANSVTYFELGVYENKVVMQDDFVDTVKEQLGIVDNPSIVDLFLPSQLYIAQGLEHNIYFKNAIIPDYGDNLSNYRYDTIGTKGSQFLRSHRFTPAAGDVGSSSLTLSVFKGRTQLLSKSTTMNVAALASGTGVTRKVLIIGDSTVDGGDINIPLKAFFDTDPMDVTFVGTRGSTGLKHEGRSGWTINDYATFGRTLFRFNVSAIPANPVINDEYANNGSTFKVVEINITSGTGYFSCERIVGSNDPILTASILTRTAGSGAATINYSTASVESANPFWNAGTNQFDLSMYLTNSSQTMASGDWIFIQLGINDQFGQTTVSGADAKSVVMWGQLSDIMAQIQAYNPDIKIGIIATIPPAATQDAAGFNYANGQTRDIYLTTGWASWHRKIQLEMDNAPTRALKRYLVGAHLNLDTDYNFPKALYKANSRNTTDDVTMQTNLVHPDTNGNAQIADVYAGIIKYFA